MQITTTKKNLQFRAEILAQIRAFFAVRNVLEVETPILSPSTNPAPHLNNFVITTHQPHLYLQTSPEFAMKRLLADDCGDIYQICKAFRADERGKLHSEEFTILEWYRVNFDHHKLMNEVDDLLQATLNTSKAERITYRDLFLQYLKLDPFSSTETIKKTALLRGLDDNLTKDRDTWLQLLLTHFIEPHLGQKRPIFVYDFPATQAMLAKISPIIASCPHPHETEECHNVTAWHCAERFEVYFKGVELANGFHELNDAREQRQRFEHELEIRAQLGLPPIPLDEDFLSTLDNLPPCAGVALGVDRLMMLAAKAHSLPEISVFS